MAASRPRRRAATLAGITAIGLVAVLGIAAAVAASGLLPPAPQHSAELLPTLTPGMGVEPGDPVAFGDGTYLDGHDYLRGVNVYSLIFAGKTADLSQVGEPASSYEYLASRGVDIVRLAVPWQRLQEIPPGGTAIDGLQTPIDIAYLDVVAEQIARAGAAGIRTVLDLHNGCTYPWGAGPFVAGSVRCGDGITEAHVAYIWGTLATRFRDDQRVVDFNVFNEPRWSVGVDNYRRFAQVAVDAIRATGDQHTVWVEGILSDVRGRLAAIAPDGPWIEDPLDRVVYSEHFYASENGATYDEVEDPRIVLRRLSSFIEWCETWSVRCSVGEVGWPSGGPGGVQSVASARRWNALFEEFYELADEHGLDVTYFAAAGSGRVGNLLAYVSGRGDGETGIDTALSQSDVIERHPSSTTE